MDDSFETEEILDDIDVPGPSKSSTTRPSSPELFNEDGEVSRDLDPRWWSDQPGTSKAPVRPSSPELFNEYGEVSRDLDFLSNDLPGTSKEDLSQDAPNSPELFTEDGEMSLEWHALGSTTVDGGSRDTVAGGEIGPPGKPPVDFALLHRWQHEGVDEPAAAAGAASSSRGRGGGRRGAAVGWMMEGRGDEKGQLRSFGHYMRLKKDKLLHQVNVLGRARQVSEIFKGVSIFVNGYTVPPALELRSLIQAHGGEYHVYYEHETTTYTVASEIATVKKGKLRKEEVVVKPELIIDSVAAGRLLDHRPYLLLPDEEELRRRRGGTISQAMRTLTEKAAAAAGAAGSSGARGEKRQVALDARSADFIDEYYARSRLHLISTLAQEMRDYVNSLRDDCVSTEEARSVMNDRLRSASQEGVRSPALPPSERAVFHLDLDCFFVSVCLRSRPELRGKPVAVTHSSGSATSTGFSEIASCSYEARARGVKNGSLVRDALRKCSDLVCVPYQFDEYRAVSKEVYDIMASHTLELRAVSCDEMYVDATCLIRALDGSGYGGAGTGIGPITIANYLRELIRERTGCPASVGIGPNMLVARMATRLAKPDGVKWVRQTEVVDFVAGQKVADLPGVGSVTMHKLEQMMGGSSEELRCSELRRYDEREMQPVLGAKTAAVIHRMVRGEDDAEVVQEHVRKSVSCDINYGIRFTKESEVDAFLGNLCAQLEKKLLQARMKAGAMTLKVMVRSADAPVATAKYLGHGRCDTHTRCGRLEPVAGAAEKLLVEARKLVRSIKAPVDDLRGIGITLNRLVQSNSAARPLASQLAKFFAPRRPGGGRSGGGGEREKEKKKEERGRKRTAGVRVDENGDEVEDHRRQMKDFMSNTVQLPTRLHIPPSSLRTLPPQAAGARLKFLGETLLPHVKVRILELMIEAPAPRPVHILQAHGWTLVQRGELLQLRQFARAMMISAEEDFVADGWLFAARGICREWEEAAARRYTAVPDLLGRESRRKWNERARVEMEEEDYGSEESVGDR